MAGPIRTVVLLAAAGTALAGCSTYGSLGYGGVYASTGYGGGYYDDPYYGWYDDYYYPGTGYYIYDRSGARSRWSDSQRRYWEARRRAGAQDNWSGYRGDRDRDHDGDRRGTWNGGGYRGQQQQARPDPRWQHSDGNNNGGWQRSQSAQPRSEPARTESTRSNDGGGRWQGRERGQNRDGDHSRGNRRDRD